MVIGQLPHLQSTKKLCVLRATQGNACYLRCLLGLLLLWSGNRHLDGRRDRVAAQAFEFEASQAEGCQETARGLEAELAARFLARRPRARFTCGIVPKSTTFLSILMSILCGTPFMLGLKQLTRTM